MGVMDPFRIYEYLSASRGRVFDWVRPLTPGQYAGEHEIGLGSVSRTLNHMMTSEAYYMLRIQRAPVPSIEELIAAEENPPGFGELEATWHEQARDTANALAVIDDWHLPIEYGVVRDGVPIVVNATASDIFTQLAFHEIHHRTQALNMLRRLGVKIEDIDYNTMMYRIREA